MNLNKVKGGVQFETAKAVVINGLPAALPLYPTQMVGYKNVLNATQVDDVATFTSRYAGTHVTCEDSKPPNCDHGGDGVRAELNSSLHRREAPSQGLLAVCTESDGRSCPRRATMRRR